MSAISAGRDLQPDEATADDGEAPARLEMGAERERVGEGAEIEERIATGDGELPRFRPRGDQQRAVGNDRAVGELQQLAAAVDGDGARAGLVGDLEFVEAERMGDVGHRRLALGMHHRLRQRWPLVGPVLLVADEGHGAVEAAFAERGSGAGAGFAGPDDDDARVHAPTRPGRSACRDYRAPTSPRAGAAGGRSRSGPSPAATPSG